MALDLTELDGQRVYTARAGASTLGFVVVDTLVAGRSRGGLRLVVDVTEGEIRAAARSMTLKYGFLGLPHGGAKAGVRGDPEAPEEERQARLRAFGAEIAPLLRARLYLPDADLGTRGDDIRWLMLALGLPVKRREWRGRRSGYYTAVSCAGAARAARAARGAGLRGCRVAIEGLGSVGASLAQLLHRRGASVVAVSTSRGALHDPGGLDVDRLASLARTAGSRSIELYGAGEMLPREALLELPVDLLAPCARHHGIHTGNAGRIVAPLICAGANDPIEPAAADTLAARGIVALPDFVTNCGGVLGGTLEFASVPARRIEPFIEEHVRGAVAGLLARSARTGTPLRALAEQDALARFARARHAAEHPGAAARLLALGLECHRRGWLPGPCVGLAATWQMKRHMRR